VDKPVLRLYPLPSQEVPLKGLYLGDNLREQAKALDRTFAYGNFITSLDGRIAIAHPTKPGMVVPDKIANPRDWRLFQELAVQADILITSGRYLRDYADGRAQEILRVYDDPQFADLKDWRNENGLKTLPDLAVISGSLDFPIPQILAQSERSIFVFTTSQSDPERRAIVEAQMGRVIVAGEKSVGGRQLVTTLSELGYRNVYSATGPRVLHLLLAAGMLDRLYLTQTSRLLGGDPFSSIVEGQLLKPAFDLELISVHYDPHALDGVGQLLTTYQRANFPK
jgi:riboflavin biosynthesis pyrimidine reductase